MRKVLFPVVFLFLASLLFLAGCGPKTKYLTTNYFVDEHEMSVNVVQISDKATMRDSGNGGLIGLMVTSGRAGKMREMFDGIEGDTIKELMRQQITDKIEEFIIVDEDSEDLLLEVNVLSWGWYAPTAAFGIRTGSYQLEILGQITIYDLNLDKKRKEQKKVAYIHAMSQKPLGNKPKASETKQAFMQTIEDFSDKVAQFVLLQKPVI